MQRLTVTATIDAFSGYGSLCNEILSGLDQRGVFCSIRPISVLEPFGSEVPVEIKSRFVHCPQPEEWELLIKPPGHLPTPDKKTIYFSMWESTVLPKEWVTVFNKAEHIIVPCEWNAISFKANGVKVPITVIPLGYSPEIFHYLQPRIKGPFVIGIAGRLAHGAARKGIRRSIDLFLQTFQNIQDVELHVKIHPDCDLGKPDIIDPRVKIVRDHLPWHKVRQWFSDIDVFMSLATSEGFGLWQLQAMASGRPIIAAEYSGMDEYMTDENSFCLPYKEKQDPNKGGGLLADISDDSVKKMLLKVYSNPLEIIEKGKIAASDARAFTWGETVQKLEKLMERLEVFQ